LPIKIESANYDSTRKEGALFKRRKYPRIDKEYAIAYRVIDAKQFERQAVSGGAINISGGGACFTAKEALEKGAMIALDINAHDLQSSILALAQVKWCKDQGDHYDVGAEFWWIGWRDSQVQHSMADFISMQTAST
jgi:c-di-GMP-binding flagellar brake protein YcgR